MGGKHSGRRPKKQNTSEWRKRWLMRYLKVAVGCFDRVLRLALQFVLLYVPVKTLAAEFLMICTHPQKTLRYLQGSKRGEQAGMPRCAPPCYAMKI